MSPIKLPAEKTLHFIAHYFDPENPRTGGEKFDFQLVKAMARQGYSLALWTDDIIPGLFKKHYLLYDLWYIFHMRSFKRGILFIDDYMHPRLFLFLMLLKRLSRIRVIGIVHHLYWSIQRGRLRQRIDRILESNFISHFDLLIVPSEYTLRSITEIVKTVPCWQVIAPGIERDQRVPAADHFFQSGQTVRLLFVGAIQHRKGVLELVEALGKATYHDTELHLVGDLNKEPAYVEKVRTAVRRSDLQNRVHFHGRMSDDNLAKMYQSADIFLLPSYHEGYGIVVVEAMQFGLPVIVSNVTALPEIVEHGVNGLLISPGDVESIARAIDSLARSPEERRRYAEANVKFFQQTNTWEDVQALFVKRVSELMEMDE